MLSANYAFKNNNKECEIIRNTVLLVLVVLSFSSHEHFYTVISYFFHVFNKIVHVLTC